MGPLSNGSKKAISKGRRKKCSTLNSFRSLRSKNIIKLEHFLLQFTLKCSLIYAKN